MSPLAAGTRRPRSNRPSWSRHRRSGRRPRRTRRPPLRRCWSARTRGRSSRRCSHTLALGATRHPRRTDRAPCSAECQGCPADKPAGSGSRCPRSSCSRRYTTTSKACRLHRLDDRLAHCRSGRRRRWRSPSRRPRSRFLRAAPPIRSSRRSRGKARRWVGNRSGLGTRTRRYGRRARKHGCSTIRHRSLRHHPKRRHKPDPQRCSRCRPVHSPPRTHPRERPLPSCKGHRSTRCPRSRRHRFERKRTSPSRTCPRCTDSSSSRRRSRTDSRRTCTSPRARHRSWPRRPHPRTARCNRRLHWSTRCRPRCTSRRRSYRPRSARCNSPTNPCTLHPIARTRQRKARIDQASCRTAPNSNRRCQRTQRHWPDMRRRSHRSKRPHRLRGRRRQRMFPWSRERPRRTPP